jgi:hypothetical protein
MQYENSVIGAVLCRVRILFVLGVVIGLFRLLSLVWRQKTVSDGRLFVALCEVSPGFP